MLWSEYIGGDYRVKPGRLLSYSYCGRGQPVHLKAGGLYTRRKWERPALLWLTADESAFGGEVDGFWGDDYPPLLYTGETYRWLDNSNRGIYGSCEHYFCFLAEETKVCIERRELRYMKYFTKHIKRTPLV